MIKKVINIEDDILKHATISRSLRNLGVLEVAHASTAEQGINIIKTAIKTEEPYELLVLDMHFSIDGVHLNNRAGEYVINKLKEEGIEIPIIVCSSIRYNSDDVFGCVWFNEDKVDILYEFRVLMSRLKKNI